MWEGSERVVLDPVVRRGLLEQFHFSKDLGSVRDQAKCNVGSSFQGEETASAKALRPEHAWLRAVSAVTPGVVPSVQHQMRVPAEDPSSQVQLLVTLFSKSHRPGCIRSCGLEGSIGSLICSQVEL